MCLWGLPSHRGGSEGAQWQPVGAHREGRVARGPGARGKARAADGGTKCVGQNAASSARAGGAGRQAGPAAGPRHHLRTSPARAPALAPSGSPCGTRLACSVASKSRGTPAS
jgi:hypothetical protein